MDAKTFTAALRNGGIGSKDRRAALAAEFIATLDATHGNSAQSKSLHAILTRAAERYTVKAERKAERAADAADAELAEAEEETPPAPVKPSKPRSKRSKSTGDAALDAVIDADEEREAGFVARMRALAAEAEASGSRV